MELQLSYNPQTRHQTSAAFLRGNSPEQWFHEMNDWEIPLKGLSCFLLPEHKNTMTPGGLLVIFKDQVPAPGKISHPYGTINGNLFIPVDATLTPALSPEEMRTLLIWHVQVYHPAIGFVGFDNEDQRSISSFLSPAQARERSWDHAHPGMPPPAYLHTISVAIPERIELTDLLNHGQSPLPLSELPGKRARRSMLMRLMDWMLRCFLRFLLAIFNTISIFLARIPGWPVKTANTGSGSTGRTVTGAASRKPGSERTAGLREKLRQWIEKTLGDIEERRDSELDRLLKMFDKNGDEALKYAIPLADASNPGRGTALQSTSLSRRETNFNLGTLFGHQPVDTWTSAESYTELLSRKYEQQAANALQEGDHRKAAYIYAHLLRNLHRAAIVLEEGQFYHEAAALYIDRLGQPLKAAECFEKGGLLLDAINIYKKLEKYEKTGDLYRQLSKEAPAQQYFQLAVDAATQQKNHMEAARILQHKSGKPEAACEVLLDGWQHGNQYKGCLLQYLQLTDAIDADSLPGKMRMIYEQKTPEHKKDDLVDTFLSFRKNMSEAAKNTVLEIAYEVVAPQIAAGSEEKLNMLKKMLPNDQELSADIYRYTTQRRQIKPTVRKDHSFQLEQHIKWLGATVIKKQLIFLGTAGSTLYLLRMLPDGNQKYYSWQYQPIADNNGGEEQIYACFSENDTKKYSGKLMYLPTSHNRRISLGKLILPSEKPFGDKVILDTTDYPANHIGGAIGMTVSAGEPVTIFTDAQHGHNSVFIKKGTWASYYCAYPDSTRLNMPAPDHPRALWGEGPFYFGHGNRIYRVDEKGQTQHLDLPDEIRHVTATEITDGMLLMACTTKGCIYVMDRKSGLYLYSDYFADDVVVRASHFVSKTYLVLATNKGTIVYNITTGIPTIKTRIDTAAPVQFILPTEQQNEVVLADEKGRITVHKIDDKIAVKTASFKR